MGDSKIIEDHPASAKQIAIARWFADYKGARLPPEVAISYFAWWRWLHVLVTRIDQEDPHAARMDFGLDSFDEENPVAVISKLKYASVVDKY